MANSPITWKQVSAPNFNSSNQLLRTGFDQQQKAVQNLLGVGNQLRKANINTQAEEQKIADATIARDLTLAKDLQARQNILGGVQGTDLINAGKAFGTATTAEATALKNSDAHTAAGDISTGRADTSKAKGQLFTQTGLENTVTNALNEQKLRTVKSNTDKVVATNNANAGNIPLTADVTYNNLDTTLNDQATDTEYKAITAGLTQDLLSNPNSPNFSSLEATKAYIENNESFKNLSPEAKKKAGEDIFYGTEAGKYAKDGTISQASKDTADTFVTQYGAQIGSTGNPVTDSNNLDKLLAASKLNTTQKQYVRDTVFKAKQQKVASKKAYSNKEKKAFAEKKAARDDNAKKIFEETTAKNFDASYRVSISNMAEDLAGTTILANADPTKNITIEKSDVYLAATLGGDTLHLTSLGDLINKDGVGANGSRVKDELVGVMSDKIDLLYNGAGVREGLANLTVEGTQANQQASESILKALDPQALAEKEKAYNSLAKQLKMTREELNSALVRIKESKARASAESNIATPNPVSEIGKQVGNVLLPPVVRNLF